MNSKLRQHGLLAKDTRKKGIVASMSALGYAFAIHGRDANVFAGRGPLFVLSKDDEGGGGDPVGMSLGKLKDAMQACSDAMADHEKTIADAGASDEDKAKATTEHGKKTKEYDGLKAQYKIAKSRADRRNDIAEVAAMAKTIQPGIIPGTVPAEAKKSEEEDDELNKHFIGYMESGNMPDAAFAALAPKSEKWKNAKGGIRMPALFSKGVINRTVRGKALPMTSEVATGSSLRFPEYQQNILMYPSEPAVAFPLVSRMSTSTGDIIFPALDQSTANGQFGGVSFGWVADGADKPEQEPKFKQIEIKTFEGSAYTELSRSMLNRSPRDLEQIIGTIFSAAIHDGIDIAIFSGSGVGRPTGILTTNNYTGVARATPSGGALVYNDVIAAEFGIPPQLRKNGVYFIADNGMKAVKELKDSQGRPLFLKSGEFSSLGVGSPVDRLNGYPVYPTTRLTYGVLGDLIFCVPGQYMVGMEQEVVIAKSEHYKFRSGVVAFNVFVLIGGNVLQPIAFAAITL